MLPHRLDMLSNSFAERIRFQASGARLLHLDIEPIELAYGIGGRFVAAHYDNPENVSRSPWLTHEEVTDELGQEIARLLGIPWKPTPELWAVIHEP